MTLYEIDEKMRELIDVETGELKDIEAFASLQMERDRKIENTALWIKNLKAEINAIKEEEQNLYKRRKADESKMERLNEYLSIFLDGETFKTPKVSLSYRHSQYVEISDKFIEWAIENRKDLLSFKAPEARRDEIKKAILNGKEIPFADILTRKNLIVK